MRRIDEIASAIIHGTYGEQAHEHLAEISQLGDVLEQRFGTPRLPEVGQTAVVAISSPKTAALLADRVWSFPALTPSVPVDIAFYGATEAEICMQAFGVTLGDNDEGHLKAASLLSDSPTRRPSVRDGVNRWISEALFLERGLVAPPGYESRQQLKREYTPGDSPVILAAIDRLQIVDEKKLEWNQVSEFRKDAVAAKAYRRFMRWINADMIKKDSIAIADEIETRMEAYRWSLAKHGITTILGAIESVLDPKFLSPAAAFVTGLGLTVGSTSATVAASSFVLGKAAITVGRSLLDITEARRGANAEVAFVCEAAKLAPPGAG